MTRRHIREKELDKLEMRIQELKTYLNTSNHTLEELLASDKCRLNKELLVLLGGMDRNTDPKLWPLFNSQGQIPVTFEPYEETLVVLKKKCTNDGVNAGNHIITFAPADDSIVTFLEVSMQHNDTVNRTLDVKIRSKLLTILGYLFKESVAADTSVVFPRFPDTGVGTNIFSEQKSGFMITDDYKTNFESNAIAAAKSSIFMILYRYRGDAPTITYSQPTGATWTNNI